MQAIYRSVVSGLSRSTDHFAPIFKPRGIPAFTANYAQYHSNTSKKVAAPESDKMEKRFLFVGLGNHDLPKTRHSVGMQVVDRMAQCLDIKFKRVKECAGSVAKSDLDGLEFVLLKPKMPMNVNGTSVAKTARYFDIAAENVYLLHDDIDKHIGNLSVKEMGSASGHNGVKSVIHSLHTDVIPRIKIGIDRPADKNKIGEYVLEKFPTDEQKIINQAVNKSLIKLTQHLEQRTGSNIGDVFKSQSESKLSKSSDQKQGTSVDLD